MWAEGTPKSRWTVTCRFETNLVGDRLHMDAPGGRIDRPAQKFHDPTFWPVPSYCVLRDQASARRAHVSFETPGALALRRDRALEWIVARNAPKERAFLVLPVLAHPIGGSSPERQRFDYAVALDSNCEVPHDVFDAHRRTLATAWLPEAEQAALLQGRALVHCDEPRVTLGAVKHAENGDGLIVRLVSHEPDIGWVNLWVNGQSILSGTLADALERDRSRLAVENGRARVRIDGGIVTVRLRLHRHGGEPGSAGAEPVCAN
jgi:hypothetical protein